MLMVSIVIRLWRRRLHIRWAMLAYWLKLLDAGFDIYINPWLIQENVWVKSPRWIVPCSELFKTLIKLIKKLVIRNYGIYKIHKVTITDRVANGKIGKFDCSTKLKHSCQLFRGSQSFTQTSYFHWNDVFRGIHCIRKKRHRWNTIKACMHARRSECRKPIPKIVQQFRSLLKPGWTFISLTRILINQTHDGTATVRPLQRVLGNSTGKLVCKTSQ